MKIFNLPIRDTFCVLSFLNFIQAKNGVIKAVYLQKSLFSWITQVQPFNVSIYNLALQKIIETELAKKGHRVISQTPLILMLTTNTQIENWGSNSRCEIFLFQNQTGRGHKERTKAWVIIYQSTKGGLLNEGNDKHQVSSMARRYRLNVNHESQSNGKVYWQASLTTNLNKSDTHSLPKQMILPIIKTIRQTTHIQKFLIK